MSIITDLRYTANLDKGVNMTPIMPSFMGGDQEAHRIIVDCYRQNSREAVDLAAAGVTAYFVRADGMTIPLTGETDGNKASVLLPAACYAVMGRFSLVVKLSMGDSINTVFWGEGAVSRSRTDVVIDPDSVIPSLEELLAKIEAIEIATEAATDAAQTANRAAAEATGTANAAAQEAVNIATSKGNEALQNVADAVARQDEVIGQVTEEMDVLQDYGWTRGYIEKSGNIVNTGSERLYSNLLLCPPNVEVEYVGETNHANISAIAFYDEAGTFISGVSNNGDAGTVVTTVSPSRTVFCRLSVNDATVNQAYYKPSMPVLYHVQSQVNELKTKFPFPATWGMTSAGTRGVLYNIDGIWKMTVVDSDYQIALFYTDAEGNTKNTGWATEVILSAYDRVQYVSLKHVDGTGLDKDAINQAVLCEMEGGAVTNNQPTQKRTYYVDCVDGSDDNNGLSVTAAFATIQKAINAGGEAILVREGTYTEGFTLTNKTGVQILINKSHSAFDAETASDNPKIIIDCAGQLATGVDVRNCSDCIFEDIEVKNATSYGLRIHDCQNLRIANCIVHDCATDGFYITDANAEFINCIAYNIGVMGGGNHNDGFNIHGTGTTNFINCSAWNCEDDGISHHDACHGYIFGGEWYNCGKGGVASPTHGATVDVIGVYSHDCGFGLYAESDLGMSKGIVKDCIFKDNATADIIITNGNVKLLKNTYDTKRVDLTSIVVEIN